jgi:ubiquinone/menaquinone biosynthesis C-methylase UbiE
MSGAKVLDIGCGPGEHSEEVLKLWKARSYSGTDISAGMVRDAKRKYPKLSLFVADSCALPLAADSFDVVTSSFIFHHIAVKNRGLALQEQLRVGDIVLLRDLFGMECGLLAAMYRLYYTIFDGSEYRFTLSEWREFIARERAEIVLEGHVDSQSLLNRTVSF